MKLQNSSENSNAHQLLAKYASLIIGKAKDKFRRIMINIGGIHTKLWLHNPCLKITQFKKMATFEADF